MDGRQMREDHPSTDMTEEALHTMNSIVKNDPENSSSGNSEDPAPMRKDSPVQEVDDRLDILQFQNKFYECIEELRIRRATDEENEDKINQLVSTQHDLQRANREEIAKNSTLSKKHCQELSELKRQHEETIHHLQAEKTKLALAADIGEKEMKDIKDDIRSLQLTKYSLEKTIRDQDQRLQMQRSARSAHLSKMTELEALGKEVGKQCGAISEQLQRLEANVREADRLHCKLTFINQHQTCTSDALKAELEKTTEDVVCLNARLLDKPNQDVKEFRGVQCKLKQAEMRLKQKENSCDQLSEQLQKAKSANMNLLESLARSQELSKRHLASGSQHADRASSLAMDVKKLQSEISQSKEDLCTKERELEAEKQRNEGLAAKLRCQEESLQEQLSNQQQENESLQEAQRTLEQLNSNWSTKNSEMVEIVRELKEKLSEYKTREEAKQTKSTNTDPRLWHELEAAEQRSFAEETEKADSTREDEKGNRANDREIQEKADNEASQKHHAASCDQFSVQIEASTSQQVASPAQYEKLPLPGVIKDTTPGPCRQTEGKQSFTQEFVPVHDHPDTKIEATRNSPPPDATVTAGVASQPNLKKSEAGELMEVGSSQDHHSETETSLQGPEMPCGSFNKKRENQPFENTVITAHTSNKSTANQETIYNNGVSKQRVSQVSLHETCKTDIQAGTNLPDLQVNQVALLKTSQILSEDSNHNQRVPRASSNILYNRPVEMEIIQQGLDGKNLSTSHGPHSEITQPTEEHLQHTHIEPTQISQDATHEQPMTNLSRVNIANSLSSKHTQAFDGASKIRSPPSYLSDAAKRGPRSSYVLPGLPMLSTQARCGVTSQAKLPSNMALGLATHGERDLGPSESANISLNEIPLVGNDKDDGSLSGKISSVKETDGSQEWPNFAEEFKSESTGSVPASMNIDRSEPRRVKAIPRRASTPAEVFPSIGSKRPCDNDGDNDKDDTEPLLFSDDDDQVDIKAEVASQINQIQSFLRSDRLKRPRRTVTLKGPVL